VSEAFTPSGNKASNSVPQSPLKAADDVILRTDAAPTGQAITGRGNGVDGITSKRGSHLISGLQGTKRRILACRERTRAVYHGRPLASLNANTSEKQRREEEENQQQPKSTPEAPRLAVPRSPEWNTRAAHVVKWKIGAPTALGYTLSDRPNGRNVGYRADVKGALWD